ncbi:hypothetical protein L3Y34_019042 [Caenorhabditis briggsae]|uniref:Uncharacterized protein n=1 Tax=Caenorhabditis briggsae TaxID=6238 RepID=A0AAE9DNU9_CAEBR|nr:hypothetical protein L3Y34_019042 [Caenorhabditis briggsae]
MVSVESTQGLEILLIGGFLVWHFGFSLVFGAFAVIIERVIASMLINNYELNDSLTIPIVLTIVSPFLLHIGENLMFCHPLFVCIVTMYGHPTWKAKFRRAFPRFRFKKAPIRVTSVDIVEDNTKKLSLETDIYFKQLKDLWV